MTKKTPAKKKARAIRQHPGVSPEDRLNIAILFNDKRLAQLSEVEARKALLKGRYPERLIALYLATRPWKKSVVLRSDLVIDTTRASHAAQLYNGIYQALREDGWWEERAEPTQFWPEGEPLGRWRHAASDRAGSFDMTSAYARVVHDRTRAEEWSKRRKPS